MHGKLIVFEGISGTGKETQAKLLQESLKERKIVSHIVYHPASEVKSFLSYYKKERRGDWKTLVYLLLADRYCWVNEKIKPALLKGEWVISLRSYISALVYQGESVTDRAWIQRQFAEFEPVPSSLFYFDIDPKIALTRIMTRHEKTGEPLGSYETRKLLTKMRNRYLSVIQTVELHSHTLDAAHSVKNLHKEILTVIKASH
ncbi:dTMP kinase [Candidatus Gottesmanbacteria bacterium]|nr:dTMP kinase [Candidatus Gottesmanbacteria bacterium]